MPQIKYHATTPSWLGLGLGLGLGHWRRLGLVIRVGRCLVLDVCYK